MTKQQVIVDGEVMTAIANYLCARPYREVAPLIQALSSVKPAPDQTGGQVGAQTNATQRQSIPEHPVDPRIPQEPKE